MTRLPRTCVSNRGDCPLRSRSAWLFSLPPLRGTHSCLGTVDHLECDRPRGSPSRIHKIQTIDNTRKKGRMYVNACMHSVELVYSGKTTIDFLENCGSDTPEARRLQCGPVETFFLSTSAPFESLNTRQAQGVRSSMGTASSWSTCTLLDQTFERCSQTDSSRKLPLRGDPLPHVPAWCGQPRGVC